MRIFSELAKQRMRESWTKARKEAHAVRNRQMWETRREELRAKISAARKGQPGYWKGRKRSPENCARMSAAFKGRVSPNKGKPLTPEKIKQLRDGFKVWVEKQKGSPDLTPSKRKFQTHQSSLEKKMEDLLGRIAPGEWKYNGMGGLLLCLKVPDFVNVNGQKKIIEVFGSHWHKPSEEPARIAQFKEYGYDTLVVWGNEFDHPRKLAKRVREFCESSLREGSHEKRGSGTPPEHPAKRLRRV